MTIIETAEIYSYTSTKDVARYSPASFVEPPRCQIQWLWRRTVRMFLTGPCGTAELHG